MEEFDFDDVTMQSCCEVCENGGTNFYLESKIFRLNATEAEILSYRFAFVIQSLCEYHYKDNFTFFELNQKTCCDPGNKHRKKIKTGLSPVSISLARGCKMWTETRLKPGAKLCTHCLRFYNELVATSKPSVVEGAVDTPP